MGPGPGKWIPPTDSKSFKKVSLAGYTGTLSLYLFGFSDHLIDFFILFFIFVAI